MSKSTKMQNAARFFMFFGLFTVLVSFGVAVQHWTLVQDVWDRSDTFEEPLDPASTTDDAVRSDWQDAQTIAGWASTLGLLGLASLLFSIILTFYYGIFGNARVVRAVLPRFWQAYLRAKTGRDDAGLREDVLKEAI